MTQYLLSVYPHTVEDPVTGDPYQNVEASTESSGRPGPGCSPAAWRSQPPATVVRAQGGQIVTDGPFAETKEQVGVRRPAEDRDVEEVAPVPDDRLRLIFTCCHPALGPRPGSP